MSDETKNAEKVIGQASGLIEKAYDDLAHPTAKSLGNTISLIPRTIGVWLGKWEKWVINGEESIRLTAQAVQEKASLIPEEKLTEPEPYVAVPAIQQLSCCYDSEKLRDMYANLLVASMNSDTKWQVHPSYVDIIKQLTPDEAKLLHYFSKQAVIPLVEVRQKHDSGYTVLKKYHLNIPQNTVEIMRNLPLYIDNLIRLKLIEIPWDSHYTTESLYSSLESSFIVFGIPQEKIEFERKIINVTSMGENFANVCLN